MENNTQKTAPEKTFGTGKNTLAFLLLSSALYMLATQYGARMYYPYLLYSYVIAIPVYLMEVKQRSKGVTAPKLFDYLFPADVWLHRSARQDYIVTLINYAVIFLFFEFLVLHPDVVDHIVKGSLEYLGTPSSHTAPGLSVIVLYTAMSFVFSDLLYYISHRMTHEIPALWEFHKIHHSAKVLTPVTLHRAHPFDIWFNISCRSLGLGLASGAFYYFYPNIEGIKTITGVNIFLVVSYVMGANLRHSHIWLSFGEKLEYVFMSPAQHQIHHSEKTVHFDKNYGSFFSAWDWFFGSLYVTHGKEELTYGLGSKKEEAELDSIWKIYITPFRNIWRMLLKSIKQKPANNNR